MRKIERQMIQAIIDRRNWKSANTEVVAQPGAMCVYLHGHNIATYWTDTARLTISACGHQTNTTKSRLNALLEFVYGSRAIYAKQFNWHIALPNQPTMTWLGDRVMLPA